MSDKTLICRLFDEGEYSHILSTIFNYLDGPSLESCALVCRRWNRFIARLASRQLRWKRVLPRSSRIQMPFRSSMVLMRCDSSGIVLGLEASGLELRSRHDLRKCLRYEY